VEVEVTHGVKVTETRIVPDPPYAPPLKLPKGFWCSNNSQLLRLVGRRAGKSRLVAKLAMEEMNLMTEKCDCDGCNPREDGKVGSWCGRPLGGARSPITAGGIAARYESVRDKSTPTCEKCENPRAHTSFRFCLWHRAVWYDSVDAAEQAETYRLGARAANLPYPRGLPEKHYPGPPYPVLPLTPPERAEAEKPAEVPIPKPSCRKCGEVRDSAACRENHRPGGWHREWRRDLSGALPVLPSLYVLHRRVYFISLGHTPTSAERRVATELTWLRRLEGMLDFVWGKRFTEAQGRDRRQSFGVTANDSGGPYTFREGDHGDGFGIRVDGYWHNPLPGYNGRITLP
jgi:hypothetical protein